MFRRNQPRRHLRVLSLILALAGIALTLPSSTVGAAAVTLTSAIAAAGHGTSRGTKPTIVLEHGAWADSSSWSGVITRLHDRGYVVLAPPNPLLSLPATPTTSVASSPPCPARSCSSGTPTAAR